MNKILVTGATGFVGSNLCETLRMRGIKFVPAVRCQRTDDQFEVGNISGETDWTNALTGCDTVIHLAARVHVTQDKESNPLDAHRKANVDVTMNLAKQAAKMGVKRFIFVSSVKVNGEKTNGKPFTCFDAPAPVDSYGQSKMEAEIALRELAHVTGLEVVIIRPPLVYGPGVRANFHKLMQMVRMGIPLPLSAINNRRSMVAVNNLVDLLITCTHHPAAAGQIFMVSDDDDVSISELLRLLANAMGKRALLLPVPVGVINFFMGLLGKSAEANRLLGSLQVDISHTKSTLGWRPAFDMAESLNKTVAYYMAKG